MSFKGHENDKVLCFISKVEHFDNSKWQFEGKRENNLAFSVISPKIKSS